MGALIAYHLNWKSVTGRGDISVIQYENWKMSHRECCI